MTTLTLLDALERPAILGPEPGSERACAGEPGRDAGPARARAADRAHAHGCDNHVPTGGGPTLEDVISGVWEGLAATRTAPCPVCSGTLVARYGSGPGPVAGRCRDCGSELS